MEKIKIFLDAIDDFMALIGINLATMVAGSIGAFVSSGEKKLGFWGKLTAIVSGGAVAHYLTPLIIDWTPLSEGSKYGFAFLLGFGGLEGVKWIILTIKKKYIKTNDLKDEDSEAETK